MGKSHRGVETPEEVEMRQGIPPHNPSIASDLGALAGLYRTVFWMIGRKSQYGRIWPPEADMGKPTDMAAGTTELFLAAQSSSELPTRASTVEVGAGE